MTNIFKAPPIGLTYFITVNDVANVKLSVNPELHGYSWQGNATGSNLEKYTISNGKVIWNNGTILQYNGVDVLPTDDIINNGVYTTRANEKTTGTIKFGSTAPTKYYLGNKAVDRLYMGNIIIYQKKILPQLATPQNLAVENTTLSFDEVENATSYEVFVDNTSIGSYQVSKGETWLLKSSGMVAPSNTIDETINFTNLIGTAFTRITIKSEGKGVGIAYYNGSNITYVTTGEDGVTGDNATLTFETTPTGELLTWLQANGVKQ